MKLTKLLIATSLLAVSLSANDVMQKSMSIMEKGMTQIQQGFLNNNLQLINIKKDAKQHPFFIYHYKDSWFHLILITQRN